MSRNWSDAENDIVVETYFQMLREDLQGRKYVKRRFNTDAQNAIGRSHASIEYKFRNVSAVLREMDFPIIDGYRPAINFQGSLRDAVLRGMSRSDELIQIAFQVISRPVRGDINMDMHWSVTPPPMIEFSPERNRLRSARRVDFAQVEIQNRDLGLIGERLVVGREQEELINVGRDDLAARVEHVSVTRGDGTGYDVLSFRPDGREKFIEVKTTRQGVYWPVLATRNEVEFSCEAGDKFELHRVFRLDEVQATASLYVVSGAMTKSWQLDPTAFRALPRDVGSRDVNRDVAAQKISCLSPAAY